MKVKNVALSLLISWVIFSLIPSLIFSLNLIRDNESSSTRNGIGYLLVFIVSIVLSIMNREWKIWKKVLFIPFSYLIVGIFGTLFIIPLSALNLQPPEKYNFYGYVLANVMYFSFFIYKRLLIKSNPANA
jgi:hypothetical protein